MNSAIGQNALEFIDSLLTAEEILESDLRVALIGELIKARQEKGLIARMEKGQTSPQLDTILKVLAPLGKTLAIVPLNSK